MITLSQCGSYIDIQARSNLDDPADPNASKYLREAVDDAVRLVLETRDQECYAIELCQYALSPRHLKMHKPYPNCYLLSEMQTRGLLDIMIPSEDKSLEYERVQDILGLYESPSLQRQ